MRAPFFLLMKRRNLLKGLIGAMLAPVPVVAALPAAPKMVARPVDIRAILTANALRDIQYEEDLRFFREIALIRSNVS